MGIRHGGLTLAWC